MATLECERCGAEFDTDREGGYEGADTTRCPKCGNKHDVPDEDGGERSGSNPDPTPPTVRIVIEVHPNACIQVATDER